MRNAVFKAMLLALVRDPAALAMSFMLPAAVFLIFALIFAGASGGSLAIRLAVLDLEGSAVSERFVQGLKAHPQIVTVELSRGSNDEIVDLVRKGSADVGVVVRGGERTLASGSGDGEAPIILVTDPTREIAIAVVEGIVQDTYFRKLPDVVTSGIARNVATRLVTLTPAQQAQLEAGLDAVASEAKNGEEVEVESRSDAEPNTFALPFERLVERQSGIGDPSVPTSISYYAGAVAIMFLLYAAMNGALTLLQEKESGLLERISTGPAGPRPVIDGKFAFLVLQGTIQVTVIFVVAWLGFGLALPNHLAPWFAVTLAAAVSAAGLMMGFVGLCRTLQQAQTLGTILVLIVSAIGGSMLPRFLMPPYIQDLGWATPNAWTLEAYASVFWRNEGWQALTQPIAVLAVSGFVGLFIAHLASGRGRKS